MKTTEFDNLPVDGLKARITELKEEYYAKRASVRAGQEKNSALLGQLKRNIARALTILSVKSGKTGK
jgi:ribosomal protein L29